MMFDPAESLRPALRGAQQRLSDASSQLLHANAAGRGAVDAAMAGTARAEIFEEALLAATHARLAEIKAATK